MRCKYGFYTCYFTGNLNFCNTCHEGQNYQMKEENKKPGPGRPKKEKPLKTKCFRVDETAYAKAQSLHGKKLSEKVNAFIKRLSKEDKK